MLRGLLRWATVVVAVCMIAPFHRSARADGLAQGSRPITIGQPVIGTVDNQTFRQVYVFTGTADEVVAINMTQIDAALDPFLLLTDERGNILALSDDNGPGTSAQIAAKRIPTDGRYFIIATRFGQEHGSTSGEYMLLLERVEAGSPATATLRYGDRVLGRITDERPRVFYFLRAQRGDVLSISMRRTSGNLDPHLDLATADGRILFSNDDDPDAEGTLDAGFTNYTISETGIYLLVATRFGYEGGSTVGSYVLSVTQTNPDDLGKDPDSARLIDYGLALRGSIDDDVPARYYRFNARRGDVITATMLARAGNLDPFLRLVDVNFFGMAQDDDGAEQKNARIAAFTIPADGMYFLIATRAGEQSGQTSGEFELQLSGRPGVVGGQALEILYGATMSGVITDDVTSEEYVFFGRRGDIVRIEMEQASGDLDSLVTVYDSDRKQIAYDDDSGEDKNALIERFELPRDDMYIIVVSRFERELGTTSGAYLLTLESVNASR